MATQVPTVSKPFAVTTPLPKLPETVTATPGMVAKAPDATKTSTPAPKPLPTSNNADMKIAQGPVPQPLQASDPLTNPDLYRKLPADLKSAPSPAIGVAPSPVTATPATVAQPTVQSIPVPPATSTITVVKPPLPPLPPVEPAVSKTDDKTPMKPPVQVALNTTPLATAAASNPRNGTVCAAVHGAEPAGRDAEAGADACADDAVAGYVACAADDNADACYAARGADDNAVAG